MCRFKNKIHTGNMEILKFAHAAQFLIHPVCRVDDVSAASKIAPAIHASRPTCCFRNVKISLPLRHRRVFPTPRPAPPPLS